jgi:hypothetical protein
MKPFRKYRALKTAGIAVLVLAGGVLTTNMYLSRHYKAELQARLPELAAKATDSLYLITAGDFRINVLTRSISVFQLHIRPDSAVVARRRLQKRLPSVLLDVTIPEIELAGFKAGKIQKSKEAICREVGIYHPKIQVTFTDTAARETNALHQHGTALERIAIRNLNIYDPEIIIRTREAQDATTFRAKGGELALRDWSYRPGKPADSEQLFFARESRIMLCNLSYRDPAMLYVFGLDTLLLASAAHTAALKGAYVKSAVSKPAFYREVKMQKEIYEGLFPLIELYGFRWEALQQGVLAIDRIDLTRPALDIYFSRLYPANTTSKVGNYPHQLLKKLNFPLCLRLVNLYGGRFHYTEVNEQTKQAGNLEFSSISGDITGISNQATAADTQALCHIRLAGKFMRKSNLGVVFDFPLNAPAGAFSVRGQLRDLDGSQVSESAKALALAEIKSLKLHRLDFNLKGDDRGAGGDITIRYNDLKVKIKKIDKKTRQLRNRGFISFVANELILFNDNPMEGEPVRVAHTAVVRDSTKSFFNLIWRNLFEAGLQTAIRQEGMTDIVKKSKANKGKQKLHFFRKLFPKRDKSKLNKRRAKRSPAIDL